MQHYYKWHHSFIAIITAAVIGFDQLTYMVHEQEGVDSTIEVCVQLFNGTIAPGISINYTIEFDDTDNVQGQPL